MTRRSAQIYRINPHYNPEPPLVETFEPAVRLTDNGDRERRDDMPSFIYKPAPEREADAKRPDLVFVVIGCAALLTLGLAAYACAMVEQSWKMWSRK